MTDLECSQAVHATSDDAFRSQLCCGACTVQEADHSLLPLGHGRSRIRLGVVAAICGTFVLADSLCAIIATATVWGVCFGIPSDGQARTYALSAAIIIGWLLSLQIAGAYELRSDSAGAGEAQRVLRAALNLAGAAAIVAYFSQFLAARIFITLVIVAVVFQQICARLVVRQVVYCLRMKGLRTKALLAVGTSESVRHSIDTTQRNPFAGPVVIGACVGDAQARTALVPGVPVLGDVQRVAAIAEQIGADMISVAGSGLGPARIRQFGWGLEGSGHQMVMAPGLTEVAGPRVHVSPVEGLPLTWVGQPQSADARRFAKRAMDVSGSFLLLLLGMPFFLAIVLVVRLTSRGSTLNQSVQIGTGSSHITVTKFRSMYVDADCRKDGLLLSDEIKGGVLDKIRHDPRVTPFGRVLRKYSLDELPQGLNVFACSMSLVAPRPPLVDEVQQYQSDVHRRLLVKPGVTGLGQVSGGSNLLWDEAVRLDLFYVENWLLAHDVAMMARAVWAAARSRGAH